MTKYIQFHQTAHRRSKGDIVPKVMHLGENFYEEFADITARLRQELTWKEYKTFYKYLKRKDLVAATRFLEDVNEERGEISFYALADIRRHTKWNEFYHIINDMTDDWQRLHGAVLDWIKLMVDNGGSKRAGKLVRKQNEPLSAQPPPKITVVGASR